MLDILKEKNPDIKFYSVFDNEFKTYGKVLESLDTTEFLNAGKQLEIPENVCYRPSMEEFECLVGTSIIENEFFGTLPMEIGCCWGHNSFLNATEWHTSSEINIAITPFVLLLGHVWDIVDNKIDSSEFTAFYVPEGAAVVCYATTLHYCPCQVSDNGFICVVALPNGTNTALETEVNDKNITAKNKWQICHCENKATIARGVNAGISGINYQIRY